MNLPRLGLSSWHTIVLGLALELAFENAGLVLVFVVTERRWRERVLVVIPLVAFVWMLGTARGLQELLTYWSNYFTFIAAHYPGYTLLYAQTLPDYEQVVEAANHQGWTAVLVTEVMVLFGGLLLLWWGSAVRWWGRTARPITHIQDEQDTGELEITIEPLSRPGRD